MTIFDKIRQRILKFLRIEHLSEDPNSSRYTFINDIETVKKQKLEEYRIWYVGDSDELQNFYTNRDLSGNAREPIYNRNKPNYFWGISVKGEEQPIKKVHSGVPKSIIDTTCNVIGMPELSCEGFDDVISDICDVNDFTKKLTQESRPLTMVEGWGGWKIIFDKDLCDHPIFQFYEGKDVEFVVKKGIVIGMVFKDYYKIKNKDYVLLETRRIDDAGNSIIEFELYRLDKSNEVTRVELSCVPELSDLPEQGYCIEGLKEVLGVPSRYLFNLFDKDYGRSFFEGKLDIFDDMDQCLSQASQTDRVSTPVEYYPADLMDRTRDGATTLPNIYNRQFVSYPSYPDGDGHINTEIQTTQPQLNYSQYVERFKSLCDVALTGLLSPATMGFDIAKKDNADAQREKEKVTIFTRDNIINAETKQLKKLFKLALMMQEYMDTGSISMRDYDVSVKYCEFANPSFESLSAILLPMWTSGAISTEMYVNKLYGDSLSDEEKMQEIAKLEENKEKDNMQMGDFGLNDINEGISNTNSEQQAVDEEATEKFEK